MKLRSIITTAAASVFMLSSCLKKTDRLGFINDKGSIVSEIATHNEGDPLVVSVEPLPAVETLDLLKLAFHNAKNLPSGDIKIKLVLKPSLITDYNTANGAALLPLPFSSYTLSDPTLEVTIPKGTYGSHQMTITVTKAALSLTETYALGFTIQTVSEGVISDLAKDFLFIIGVKNKYDGDYSITGTFVDASNADFVSAHPHEWYLITNGPAQNIVFDPNLNGGLVGYSFIVNSTGAGSYYGSFGLVVNFDPATDKITSVTNYYGQPSGNGRSATLDPSGINTYNPATKTIKIKYWMDQPSVITPHRAYMNETWTFLGARP
jgi:hypothetical protein